MTRSRTVRARVVPRAAVERAARRESWGSLRWVANTALAGLRGLTLGRVVIRAGRANPPHLHPNCDELLYLWRGRLAHVVGRRTYRLAPGDTLVIPRGAVHSARALGASDAEMIVAYNSGRRQFRLAGRRR